jgi:hypothetical protein
MGGKGGALAEVLLGVRREGRREQVNMVFPSGGCRFSQSGTMIISFPNTI